MSTLFNLRPPVKDKPVSLHPWRNTIKDILSHRIKHAHNSVKNPVYPKIKEKVPDAKRTKFTVIGDRVTREYIYCVNIVNGLHKYRWKKFDVPHIRGVTSVEWEDVWHSLKIQYGGFAHCLKSRVAVLVDDKFLGGESELKELVETKYIYHIVLDYCSEAVANFACYIRCSGKPCAYMHIAIDGEHVGTLIFMLFADVVPYTCENFLRLCKETKGGYSGTPIHRIVKDGWVQGGGYGLKNTDLDCENFIIPHDRRGLLCMANDGRHVECSTQFFVLLQPAPWMAYKYVAFGQLIEGAETLKKIENVPTWYESPMKEIVIYRAGIFNMECHDIMINRGANEYISGHIEDLNVLGDILIEALIERVFLEAELREVDRLAKELLGEEEIPEEGAGNIHATERFIRKKEEIEKQIRTQPKTRSSMGKSASIKNAVSESENNEFDVDEYQLMEEETDYKHISLATTLSLIVRPEVPYYIPLTDVPYPGETDSTYDLKKFLKGHYCLEADLEVDRQKKTERSKSYPSEIYELLEENWSETPSKKSLESEDEREIKEYLKANTDRASFAGDVIRTIGRGYGKFNLLEEIKKQQLYTDDQIRRLRLASEDLKNQEHKHVSISVPRDKVMHSKIKRRQTGFVRPEDIEKVHLFDRDHSGFFDEDEGLSQRKVRISSNTRGSVRQKPLRRPTAFVFHQPSIEEDDESDTEVPRPSVMQRLYEDVDMTDEHGPTLKNYKPYSEIHHKSMMLTVSSYSRIKSDHDTRGKVLPHSAVRIEKNASYENVLNLQHSKRVARTISSDYVKTIDQMEHKTESTLRSIEFAKTRPSMKVSDYQLKNQKYQEGSSTKSVVNVPGVTLSKGLRLPGDTPLHSLTDTEDKISETVVINETLMN